MSEARRAAWAKVDAALDAHGGKDSAEYRAAWAELEHVIALPDPNSCWWDVEDGERQWSEWRDHDFDTVSGACVNCHLVPESDDSGETDRNTD